jgi:hypothetical protein
VHLSVYDLNENLSAREIVWHMIHIFWFFGAGFFCLEWWRDDHREGGEIKSYDLGAGHRQNGNDDNIFADSSGQPLRDKNSDEDEVEQI